MHEIECKQKWIQVCCDHARFKVTCTSSNSIWDLARFSKNCCLNSACRGGGGFSPSRYTNTKSEREKHNKNNYLKLKRLDYTSNINITTLVAVTKQASIPVLLLPSLKKQPLSPLKSSSSTF